MAALVFKSQEREKNRIRASIMPTAEGDITLGCVAAEVNILVLPGNEKFMA